jgi:hypothetical protein
MEKMLDYIVQPTQVMNRPQQTQSQQSSYDMVHICVVQEVFSIVDELVATLESMFGIFEGNADVEPNVAATKTGE